MKPPAVYERLVRAARARELVHYGELAKMLGIDMDNPHFAALVGRVLGEISEDEVAAGRPMLSAIVVVASHSGQSHSTSGASVIGSSLESVGVGQGYFAADAGARDLRRASPKPPVGRGST